MLWEKENKIEVKMKIRLLIILLITLFISSCCNTIKYSVHNSDLNLEIIKSEPNPNSTYNAYIYGHNNTDDPMYKIINIAESVYLPNKIVIGSQNGESVVDLDTSNVWWRGEFDGIKIPYSITKSAVNYYIGLIESFRKDEFDKIGVYPQKSASFNYIVEMRKNRFFERDGYVFKGKKYLFIVTLTMKWESYCGDLCALNFEKERIVVISDSGKVLAVFGDGPAKTVVS